MSNLIKAAEELEYVPKEDLIRMAESGDSRFPPYLVLSEIQRRTQNEKAYSAMQPPPTTTVAEEKVAEFAQSGLGGMASPLFSPPPEDLPMSPPMQMAASGGLTGYANKGRTTYQSTFGTNAFPEFLESMKEMYGPNLANSISAYQDMRTKVQAMDDFEENLANSKKEIFPTLNTKPDFNFDTSNIVPLGASQADLDAQVIGSGSNKPLDKLEKELIAAKENLKNQMSIGDRGGLGGGTSYIDQAQARVNKIENQIASTTNKDQIKSDAKLAMQDTLQEFPEANENPFRFGRTPPNETATATTDVFGTLDELRKRMKDVEYKSPTADDLRDDRTSETLMYLGSLIAGSTSRKEFGQGLADLTSKVVASKRADDRFLNEAKLKERGLLSSDIQLATALESLKAKAIQAKNSQMKNDIDLAQVLTVRLQTAIGDERTLIENQINSLISPYLSSGIAATPQADLDALVKDTKS
tara:strand:+ start:194 stop:1603 length:1410 start_codon:yes stop_codon:yes gene_type:complete